jgi:SAM-dependent methyltransferase
MLIEQPLDLPALQCPRTGTSLQQDEGHFINARGDRLAEVRNGVICFRSASSAEDAETISKLATLNRLARETGWQTALTQVYNEAFVRYVTSPVRRAFLDHLPTTPQTHALEIGPGLGQFTAALASRTRFVDAIEVVEGQAGFAAERMRQEGVTNVRVVAGGGDCLLPYPGGTFDLIVINLVFEWCAVRSGEDHAVVQSRLLSEMYRVLRPGGFLYLATKNRFGISYLCGKPDEHFSGMRFGSALPRALARLFHGRRQDGLLHSYSGLRRMLAEAGFATEKSWWAVPDYRFPSALIATDPEAIRLARASPGFDGGRSRLERAILARLPARLVKHVMPGLNFLAVKKDGAGPSPRSRGRG